MGVASPLLTENGLVDCASPQIVGCGDVFLYAL
jgi:hypothetical protein